MTSSPSDREVLEFMMAFSRLYLSSGGPTSRLEDSLIRVGGHFGREAEVFATPTGVFVTLNDPLTTGDPVTALARIRETGTHLGRLCELERLLEELRAGRITVPGASATLRSPGIQRAPYSPAMTGAAALLAGFVASYVNYQRFAVACWSGAITAAMR